MTKNLLINERLEKYISDHSYDLHPVQEDIIRHNDSLGEIKKMQISITQAYFFQFFLDVLVEQFGPGGALELPEERRERLQAGAPLQIAPS